MSPARKSASAASPGAAQDAKFFLPYQAKWIKDNSRLKLMEKSRQIGLSWSSAYRVVAHTSAKGARYDSFAGILNVAAKIAACLGNDVAAARARGDSEALERALRLYRGVASIVKESAELQLKTQAEERAGADLALQREKFEDQKRRNAEAAEKLKAALTARPDGGIAPETRAKIEEALNLL